MRKPTTCLLFLVAASPLFAAENDMSQKVEAARRANSALAECAQREIPSLDDRISQAPVIASGLYYACLTEAVIAVAARAAVTGQRASEEIDEMKAGQDLLLLDVVLRYRAAQR